MSRDLDQDVTLLEERAQLVEYFRTGEKDPSNRRLGTEHEKFVFKKTDRRLLTYEEPGGFGDLFAQLEREHGWEASWDEGHIVALVKDGGALTLEPGGQFELSGKITNTVFETRDELDAHIQEIKAIAGERLSFVPWGMNPFDKLEDAPWMPKSRYGIMKRYLPTRGDLAHWMMKMTCTVQGNYDYVSEADAVEIIRTSLMISPTVSALFANSPLRFGAPNDFHSFRCHIWTRTDPDRTGFPDFMFGDDWGYGDYADYVLDIPMFFIRRGDNYIDCAGLKFKDFMRQGFEGHKATMGDFELHLSTIFPEVRMKRYIEVRGADAGSREMILALPALWKGILYSDTATRVAARAIVSDTSPNPEQLRGCFASVHAEGLHAQTPCGPFHDLATELVKLSRRGLDMIAARDGHPSESPFLDPLDTILERRLGGSDLMLADFERLGGDRGQMIDAWSL